VTVKDPLREWVVLVTRPPEQSEELSRLLRERGWTVISAPAIELVPAPTGTLDRAARELASGGFEWALFTSRAGVEALASALTRTGKAFHDVRSRLAVVGEGTARALRTFGVEPDLIPSTFTTSDLGNAMPHGSGRVLLARADIAAKGLEETLIGKGWTPVRVDAYRTRLASLLPEAAAKALGESTVDAVTFTSASTVRGFLALAGSVAKEGATLPPAVCIGPITAQEARRGGLDVVAVAKPHTIDGLVAALEGALGPPGRKES
jgi:uroporphyrinogen-III synthase